MMTALGTDYLGLIISAADAAFGGVQIFPVFSEGISIFFTKRKEQATEIFLEEMKRGNFDFSKVSQGDLVMIAFRTYRAAIEGAARVNLRLMAKVAAGMVEKHQTRPDLFLWYADMLSTLRREELVLLATLHRLTRTTELAKLRERGERPREVKIRAIADLVPGTFPTELHLEAALGSLVRTGFVLFGGTIGEVGNFGITPLLDELMEYASVEDALQQEPAT